MAVESPAVVSLGLEPAPLVVAVVGELEPAAVVVLAVLLVLAVLGELWLAAVAGAQSTWVADVERETCSPMVLACDGSSPWHKPWHVVVVVVVVVVAIWAWARALVSGESP